jgi:hypothetical protein
MKTIEEKAREYALGNCGIETFDYLQNAFIAGVVFSQCWISVDEELPEDTMETEKDGNYTSIVSPVLIKTSNSKYAITKRQMFLNHGWEWKGSGTFNNSVTHWRPIELK